MLVTTTLELSVIFWKHILHSQPFKESHTNRILPPLENSTLKSTSHMSQGLGSCNQVGLWLSSKGRTSCSPDMVCWNLRQAYLLEVAKLYANSDAPWSIIHSIPCSLFFGPLGLHLVVWSELVWFGFFWPMRDLRMQGSHAFNSVYEVTLRATLHTSQEPWPCNCESPNKNIQRPSQDTFKTMQRGHKPSRVVWSHTWPVPQPKIVSMNFYSCRSSHMIKYNISMVVSVRNDMVSWFKFC